MPYKCRPGSRTDTKKHKMRKFTAKEDAMIRRLYLTTPAKRIAKMLGRSDGTVRQRMAVIGIKVPKEVAERFKAQSRFKPGHTPLNAGKTWDEFMPKESQERSRKGTFQKGRLPHNTKADGVISIRTDKEGREYQWIRISKAKWKMLHVYNWEKVNGEVPNGMIIVFKDGDRMNCHISNLECITLQENMRRNSYWINMPRDMAHVVQLRGAITRKINKHIKKLKNEKQDQRPERSHVRPARKARG